MKRLTINQVAKANIRMNRKAYTSLFLGILLAVYLATATSLCCWGTVRGHEERMAERVGWMDMFLLGNEPATDEQLRRCGFFSEIGHVTVNACVEGTEICAGYYDGTAEKLMGRKMKEGRLPEKAGEIAAEKSVLIRLDLEDTAVGDTLKLAMQPVYGIREERTFTLVGILNEQTGNLDTFNHDEGMRFPALLVSPAESYETGGKVVHRVLTYAPLITYNQVQRNCPVYMEMPYGISRETGMVVYNDSGWDRAQKIVNRILIWAVLGAALMLCACVAITSAMESLLTRKTEDIGMLRAIGATKDDIRRIYGTEAWLLTATALPAGLLGGILTAWVISRIVPDYVVFSLSSWLLVPILGLSALCVFVASRVPLYHASRQMPMGVLRDTALLRRAARIRNRRSFRPDSLIAGRRAKLYPLRQLGAMGMTALTLLSALMLCELALGMNNGKEENAPAFQLWGAGSPASEDVFTQVVRADDMSRDDLRRIAAVPGVERIRSITEMSANLLLDQVPEYFRPRSIEKVNPNDGTIMTTTVSALEGLWASSEWLFYTDEDITDAVLRRDEDYVADLNIRTMTRMRTLQDGLGLTETPVPVRVFVADLDVEALKAYVVDGEIDPDRLDSGEQVLIYAPTACARQYEAGGTEVSMDLYPGQVRDEDWEIVIRNDAFRSGMTLDLLEIAAGEEDLDEYGRIAENLYQDMKNIRVSTTIGAVLSGPAHVNEYSLSSYAVILSSGGAEALGMLLPEPEYTDIWIRNNLTPEEEAEIEDRISQITVSSWADLQNRQQQNRVYMAKKLRQILLFTALILLFFAVSVSMQVSNAARQIRSEARTIGTLRAVGADLKTLVGCYRLPVWGCAAMGLIPSLLFYAVTALPGMRLFTTEHPLMVIPVLAMMAACIALACIVGIRSRLAAVTHQSIVDNIREL